MTTHVGSVETEIEVVPEGGPGIESPRASSTLDERSRVSEQLRRERSIVARTRAEGFDD